MGNTRKAFIARGQTERDAEKFLNYAIRMNDDTFDGWLMHVVSKRAERGSERAQEMIEIEKASHAVP